MERFPEDIKRLVFLFDPTRKDLFDQVIHQINFIPVLFHLHVCVEVGGDLWKEHLLAFYRCYATNPPWIVEINRRGKWKLFLERHLKKISN